MPPARCPGTTESVTHCHADFDEPLADVADEGGNAIPATALRYHIRGAAAGLLDPHASDCAPCKDPGEHVRALVYHGLERARNLPECPHEHHDRRQQPDQYHFRRGQRLLEFDDHTQHGVLSGGVMAAPVTAFSRLDRADPPAAITLC